MTAPFCALLLMAMLAFVLVGCSDDSNSVASPGSQPTLSSTPPGALAKAGSNIRSGE